MNVEGPGLLVFVLVGVGFLLFVSAYLLIFACGVYNSVFGRTVRRSADRDDDLVPLQSASGYDYRKLVWQRAGQEQERETVVTSGVPVPTLGRAMGIVITNAVVSAIANVVVAVASGVDTESAETKLGERVGLALAQLVFGYLTSACVLSSMLPTRFGRACGVAGVLYFVYILIGFLICLGLFFTGLGVGLSNSAGR
jgi:hypothetical protein